MKKIIIGGLLALSLIALPQKASAASLMDIIRSLIQSLSPAQRQELQRDLAPQPVTNAPTVDATQPRTISTASPTPSPSSTNDPAWRPTVSIGKIVFPTQTGDVKVSRIQLNFNSRAWLNGSSISIQDGTRLVGSVSNLSASNFVEHVAGTSYSINIPTSYAINQNTAPQLTVYVTLRQNTNVAVPRITMASALSTDASGVSKNQTLGLCENGTTCNAFNPAPISCPAGYICRPGQPTTPQIQTCPSGYTCEPVTNNGGGIPVNNGTCGVTSYLGVGSTGDQVRALQRFLINNGFAIPDGVTGYFGESTKAAVIKYQASVGLETTGTVGPLTLARICGSSSTTSSGVTLVAALLNTSVDRAGAWNNFGPGAGNVNKNTADWNWKLSVTNNAATTKTIKRITIKSSIVGEVWSTGYSRYLADGTDLYGYDEHPYPLVVERGEIGQLNRAYDSLSEARIERSAIFSLYGQKEGSSFTGGKIIVEFTDGTSVTANVVACPAGYTCSDPILPGSNSDTTTTNVATITGLSKSSALAGEKVNIYASNTNSNYQYYIYMESPAGFSNTTSAARVGDGVYSFAMSKDQQAGPYKLTLRAYSGSNLISQSSNKIDFTIVAPVSASLKISTPTAGTTLRPGQIYQVVFTGGDVNATYKIVAAPTDGSTVREITTSTGVGNGTIKDLIWTVPSDLKPASYTIKFYLNGETVASSGVFTVISNSNTSGGAFRFNYPLGGENLRGESSYFVRYYATGNGEKIRFDLVNANGDKWWLGSDIPLQNNGMEGMLGAQIPDVKTGTYKIKVTRQSDNTVIAESANFTVTEPEPAISVLKPYVNETYPAGAEVPIQYQTSHFPAGTSFEIKLASRELVVGSAIRVITTIASGLTNTSGIYNWKTSTSLSPANNYLILVCAAGATVDKCGHSLVFKVDPPATPSGTPSGTPVSQTTKKGSLANVMYAIGDMLDSSF